MGLLSCCFGGGKTKEDDQRELLQPAPQQRQWRGQATAPAFGEGALREDEWAPRFKKPAGGNLRPPTAWLPGWLSGRPLACLAANTALQCLEGANEIDVIQHPHHLTLTHPPLPRVLQ